MSYSEYVQRYNQNTQKLRDNYDANTSTLRNNYQKNTAPKPKRTYQDLVSDYGTPMRDMIRKYETNTQGIRSEYEKNLGPRISEYEKNTKDIRSAYDKNKNKILGIEPESAATDIEPSTPNRDVDRGGAKGTQTSPSPAKPESFDAVAARIQAANPGVRFTQDYQFQNENNGSQSNSLPGTPGYNPNQTQSIAIEGGPQAGKTAYVDNLGYEKYAPETQGVIRAPVTDASVYDMDYFTGGTIAKGAQKGESAAPDKGDEKTQISSRLQKELDGVKAFDASKYKGNADDPTMKNLLSQSKSRDRRSEAFLDGSDDSMMALRAAELSQGYITAGANEKFARGADGEMVKLNGDAVAALKADRNAVASQDFLKQYMQKPATPADQQSPDSEQPVAASTVSPEQLSESVVAGTPFFETDSTKIDGVSGYGANPTETNVDIRSPLTQNYSMRSDVSEPSHNWQPTEYDVEESLYGAREPYMRY